MPQQTATFSVPEPYVPPEPHCAIWYKGNPCDLLKQQYQDAAAKHVLWEEQKHQWEIDQLKTQAAEAASQQVTAKYQAEIQSLENRHQEEIRQVRVQTENQIAQAKSEGMAVGATYGAISGIALTLIAVALIRMMRPKDSHQVAKGANA
jgi:hypothetical protein